MYYLGILVILVIILLLVKTKESKNIAKEIKYIKVDSTQISKIQIINDTDTLLFAKEEDWEIIEPIKYPIDTRKKDQLLKGLVNLTLTGLVSENKEAHSEYGVDDSSGIRISVYKGDKMVNDFIIGKCSKDYSHSYLREIGSDKVYQNKENFYYQVNSPLKKWRDRSITSIELEDIKSITIKVKDNEYSLTFADTVWMYKKGKDEFPLKENIAKSTVNKVAKMRAVDFIDNKYDEYKDRLAQSDFYSRIDLIDDNIVELKGFLKEKRYVIQRDNEAETLFEIYEGTVKGMDRDVDYFERNKYVKKRPAESKPSKTISIDPTKSKK